MFLSMRFTQFFNADARSERRIAKTPKRSDTGKLRTLPMFSAKRGFGELGRVVVPGLPRREVCVDEYAQLAGQDGLFFGRPVLHDHLVEPGRDPAWHKRRLRLGSRRHLAEHRPRPRRPGNNNANGHVTLDFSKLSGVVTSPAEPGSSADSTQGVIVTDNTNDNLWQWDGTYSFTPPGHGRLWRLADTRVGEALASELAAPEVALPRDGEVLKRWLAGSTG
jgi:hypothetical protein